MKRCVLSIILTIILNVAAIHAQNVLIIWDIADHCTPNLVAALTNTGMTVTLSNTSENDYNGSNPSPSGFDAVIHINGTTHAGQMPLAGQQALVDFVVIDGGAYIHCEWVAYEFGNNLLQALADLILFRRASGSEGTITYTEVSGMEDHPILANVPSSFSFTAGWNVGSVAPFGVNPAVVLMRDHQGNDAVAIREFGNGRIVGFNHAGNYSAYNALCDVNVQQLYIDGILWAISTPEPTATPTATPTDTPEPTATPTDTPEPTATPTDTPEPTATPTDTPEPTATPTDTPAVTPTPAPFPAAGPAGLGILILVISGLLSFSMTRRIKA
ncbi:hypothetical protein JXA80_04720 [bacterium]|nr:hypothetical protein [candidate division CSSED10-310 bacterium]